MPPIIGTINNARWGQFYYFHSWGVNYIKFDYFLCIMDKEKLWTDYENHLLNEGLSENRRKKLRNMFNVVTRALSLDKAERKDIETFINKLNRNEFKTQAKTNYSGNAKSDIKKFLKQFFKWYKGESEYYPKEVSWLKCKISKEELPTEKDILNKDQVVKLSNCFEKYEYKILTLVLFDSGFRIGEIESAKKKDLTLEVIEDNNSCFFIKCNVSKTFTRTVDISLFTEELKSFVNSEEYKSKQPDDPLFNISYESFNKMLKRYSERLFKLKISPHNLRHSSATLYADIYNGNVVKLASRYGWSYSAKELQVYVRQSKTLPRDSAKITFRNEINLLKQEIQKLKEDNAEIRQLVINSLKGQINEKKK